MGRPPPRNRWSNGKDDPLAWHLEDDPLQPECGDGFKLPTTRRVKDLIAAAISENNRGVYTALRATIGKIKRLEGHMSAFDDQVAELDQVTNDLADDLAAIADKMGKKDQADADKLRAAVEKLRAVGQSADNLVGNPPATEEPVADGEAVPNPPGNVVTPAEGQSDIPVSQFPAEENPEEDGPVADGEAVPDPAPSTDSDVAAPSGTDQGTSGDSNDGVDNSK